jgi:hypothetical protein
MSAFYERGIDAFLGLVNTLSARTGMDVSHLLVYGLLFLIALSVLGRR